MGLDQFRRVSDYLQAVGASNLAKHQGARKQRQAPCPGNRQRHTRTFAGIAAVRPIANQQEGTEAGQLPEDNQQQQIIGQDDAEHRHHKQLQERIKAAEGILLGEVIAGVDNHQQADPEDQQHEHQPQTVQTQAEVQAQLGNPIPFAKQHLPLKQGRHIGYNQRQRQNGPQRRGKRAEIAPETLA